MALAWYGTLGPGAQHPTSIFPVPPACTHSAPVPSVSQAPNPGVSFLLHILLHCQISPPLLHSKSQTHSLLSISPAPVPGTSALTRTLPPGSGLTPYPCKPGLHREARRSSSTSPSLLALRLVKDVPVLDDGDLTVPCHARPIRPLAHSVCCCC